MMNLEANEKKRLLEIFSANLATYRKAMKLSQEAFGVLIGITRQTVSSIERGAYPLTWSIFLSCLFICASHVRAKKLILNAFAGEDTLFHYLTGMMGDGKLSPPAEPSDPQNEQGSDAFCPSCGAPAIMAGTFRTMPSML